MLKKLKEFDLADFDFDGDVKIDADDLPEEHARHPELAWKYGKAWVAAVEIVQNKDQAVKVIRSTIIKEQMEGDGKAPTGAVMEASYRTDKRHQDAKAALIEAEFVCNILKVALDRIQFDRVKLLDYEERSYMARLDLREPSAKANDRATETSKSIKHKMNRGRSAK